MKYKVTIEKIINTKDERYPDSMKVYEQVVDSLDVASIVKAVNDPANQTNTNENT